MRRHSCGAGTTIVLNAVVLTMSCLASAQAAPDLRLGRPAGPLTVYPDDTRRDLFYYPPGDLAIATLDDGAPDVRLLHVRYTGSVVHHDQGASLIRSIFTVRVALSGPTTTQLTETRKVLTAGAARAPELRPLPIRHLESAIVYAPIASTGTEPGTTATATSSERPLPTGHFESPETPKPAPSGFWLERVYTLRLEPEDAQLLSSALEHHQVALSIGYAFLAEGIGPDQPLQELTGSPALVDALRALIEPATDDAHRDAPAQSPAAHVVRAGAVAVTADLARWPQLVRRVDINDAAPPGYAALDIYCFDFNGGESALYEKRIEIEASGIGGRPVIASASFNRAQPDLYARSLRFPVAVRLDRPYRFRVVEIAPDGTASTTAWREQASWTALLDVSAQGATR